MPPPTPEVRVDRRNWASGVKFQAISTKNSAWQTASFAVFLIS